MSRSTRRNSISRPRPHRANKRHVVLISRRWTHGDELESSALGPRSIVVHLIGDIVDDAARPDGNDIVLVELGPRADQESSGQDRDESFVRMRVRLAPLVWTPF